MKQLLKKGWRERYSLRETLEMSGICKIKGKAVADKHCTMVENQFMESTG